MDVIAQLGLDSWLGLLSFALTVASFVLPVLMWFNKRRKKSLSKLTGLGGNYNVIADSEFWSPAPAKILKFAFATKTVTVHKKMLKNLTTHGPSPLIAVVEYQDVVGNFLKSEVFIGDEVFSESEIINIKYNRKNPTESIFVGN